MLICYFINSQFSLFLNANIFILSSKYERFITRLHNRIFSLFDFYPKRRGNFH